VPINLVLIGPPGVGKGTQAAMLNRQLGLVQLASGDVFRSEIASGTELGRGAKVFIDRGQLVPDDLTIGMMQARFTTQEARTSGFVLDGFPRTVAQAEALDAKLASLGIAIARVVSLEVGDEVVVERLSGRRVCEHCGEVFHIVYRPPKNFAVCDVCGNDLIVRSDDKEETVRNRLRVFHEQTAPVLAYYEKGGRLHHVDGTKPAEDVFHSVIEGLRV
jgi:adenylate kinase